MNKKRIVIADDHALFRNGLKMLIGQNEKYEVVAEASNGKELIGVLEQTEADLILLDISMPEMDGIEAAGIITERFPQIPILTLSMFGEEDYYFKMVTAGAKGFLLKNSDISEVYSALDTVLEGGSYFSQELLVNLVNNLQQTNEKEGNEDALLSEREKEILFLICKGFSNCEIGDKLFISKRTVDKHRANILAKTSCKNTANLVVYAIKNGLVEI